MVLNDPKNSGRDMIFQQGESNAKNPDSSHIKAKQQGFFNCQQAETHLKVWALKSAPSQHIVILCRRILLNIVLSGKTFQRPRR